MDADLWIRGGCCLGRRLVLFGTAPCRGRYFWIASQGVRLPFGPSRSLPASEGTGLLRSLFLVPARPIGRSGQKQESPKKPRRQKCKAINRELSSP